MDCVLKGRCAIAVAPASACTDLYGHSVQDSLPPAQHPVRTVQELSVGSSVGQGRQQHILSSRLVGDGQLTKARFAHVRMYESADSGEGRSLGVLNQLVHDGWGWADLDKLVYEMIVLVEQIPRQVLALCSFWCCCSFDTWRTYGVDLSHVVKVGMLRLNKLQAQNL